MPDQMSEIRPDSQWAYDIAQAYKSGHKAGLEEAAKVADDMQVEIDDETKGYWSDEEANGGHSASRTIAERIRARVKEIERK
jgi:hypothetical protein